MDPESWGVARRRGHEARRRAPAGYKTGVGIAPQGDQELAGQRHDQDPENPPPGAGGAGLEPPAR